MKQWCQVVIMLLCVVQFVVVLHSDFHGREARKPGGFSGALQTIGIVIALVLVYWQAGAFSCFF